MKTLIQKIIVAYLSVNMLLVSIGCTEGLKDYCVTAEAADLTSGKCGDNVTYVFSAATGTLTISGEGPMFSGINDDPTKYNNNPYIPFYGNDSIKHVVIKSGVTYISDHAFFGCNKLTSVIIPDSVKVIGDCAFYACGLKSIVLPDGLEVIGDSAFAQSDLTSIYIPDSVTRICSHAFSTCVWLTFVNIPKGVYNIADNTFYACNRLEEVDIQNGVTSISVDAFAGCNSLKKIRIPESVHSIYSGNFNGDTVIYGVTDSFAQTYAKKNNITFKNISLWSSKTENENRKTYSITYNLKGGQETFNPICYASGSENFSLVNPIRNGYTFIGWTGSNGDIPQLNVEIQKGTSGNLSYSANWVYVGGQNKSYGITTKKNTKADDVQSATVDFYSAMNGYIDAYRENLNKEVQEEGQIVNLKDFGKQLRVNDEKTNDKYINMANENIPDKAWDAIYYTLASYVHSDVISSVDLGKLDFKKSNDENALKIVNSIIKGFHGNPYEKQYNGYTVTIRATGMWNSFSGSVEVSRNGKKYTGSITSTTQGTQKILSEYINQLSDMVKDSYTYALYSVLQEFDDVTGLSEITNEALEEYLTEFLGTLQSKGFGKSIDIIYTFKTIKSGYKSIEPIMQAKNSTQLTNALKNAETTYSEIENINFSDKNIKNKIVKNALNNMQTAKKELEVKFTNYLYNQNNNYQEQKLFGEKVTNFFKGIFQCPVDFEVYDNNNKLIGYVDCSDKHDSYIWYSDDIYIEVNDDAKYLYIPKGKKVRLQMIGTGYGEMNYIIEEFIDGEATGRVNYYNIPLNDGMEYTQSFSTDLKIEGLIDSNPIVSNNTEIFPDEYINAADSDGFVEINTSASEGGITIGDGQYPKGDKVNVMALTNKNYVFEGWYDGDNLLSLNTSYELTATDDLTIKAKFEKRIDENGDTSKEIYSLTYDLNGGTVRGNPSSYTTESDSFTLQNPTRSGYTFTGWTGSNGSTPQMTVTIAKGTTENLVYIANWQKNSQPEPEIPTYSITYDLAGGSVSGNPTKYTSETPTFVLKNPSRSGYTFAGWTGSNGNTAQTTVTVTKGMSGNLSYTANWKQNAQTYSITYNLARGSVTGNPTSYTTETDAFTLRNPARNGYTFMGWTGSNGNTPQMDVRVEKGTAGNLSYTANWKLNDGTYTISYDLAGGTVSANPDIYTIDTNTFTLNNPTRQGYTFTGWTGSNGTVPQTSVSVIKGSTGDLSYTANWKTNEESAEKRTYTITYVLNGGFVTGNPLTYTTDTNTFVLINPTRPGYTFVGWTGANGSIPQISVSVARGMTGNLIYAANWIEGTSGISDNGNSSDSDYDSTDDTISDVDNSDELIDAIESKKGKVTKVTAGSGKVTFKYKKVNISGKKVKYQVAIKIRNGESWKKSYVSGTKKTFKNLKKGKVYWVSVRPYITVDGTRYFGKWANTKVKKTR